MSEKTISRACEIISQNIGEKSYCELALIDLEGYPTISTITASKAEGIKWLTFCTDINSDKVNRIKNCSRASVCFNSNEYNITLVGKIDIITDSYVKEEMWYEGLTNHFISPQDPNYCVLRFETERYNLLVDWEELKGQL